MNDHELMARALRLARRGRCTTDPNPAVGCVIVNDGEIVGEGWHERAGEAHAEVRALQRAGTRARGATVYVTLEPCSHHGRTPPCSDALIDAGVARVVVAMRDPNPQVAGEGLRKLEAAGIEVVHGIMQEQAEDLNRGFIRRMRDDRPHVVCKLAMSMDGRTAMASGESRWITSAAARRDVHRLRACSSAIMTGIGTVLADDPAMTARHEDGSLHDRQPLRIVLDPRLSTPPQAKILRQPGRTLIITAIREPDVEHPLREAGAEILCMPGRGDFIDLAGLMEYLATEEINTVLLETGATLSGAMLQAGLIDELIVYMAPHLMGDGARALFNLPGLERMEQRIGLTIHDIRAIGDDWRIHASIQE